MNGEGVVGPIKQRGEGKGGDSYITSMDGQLGLIHLRVNCLTIATRLPLPSQSTTSLSLIFGSIHIHFYKLYSSIYQLFYFILFFYFLSIHASFIFYLLNFNILVYSKWSNHKLRSSYFISEDYR